MAKVAEETDKGTLEQKRRRALLGLRETSARMEECASKERPSAGSAVMPVARICQPAKNSLGRTKSPTSRANTHLRCLLGRIKTLPVRFDALRHV